MTSTMAEISLEEKNSISHRGKAMEKLLCHLSANPGQ
jgi:inosine/xanthosine triphosphate pyrophosphatase family protein